MDRERVSLSLKSTQEDPWQAFARTHAIGQVVPGRVTKLVPFGAFVRVEEGIEGLVHISELADRHVEIPEQVVQVGDEIFVKIIDIDLDRRRISLSLKQANEGTIGEAVGEDFDPTLYGMCEPPTTNRATTCTRMASTRRPTSGSRASRSSVTSGSTSTLRLALATRRTASRSRESRKADEEAAIAAAEAGDDGSAEGGAARAAGRGPGGAGRGGRGGPGAGGAGGPAVTSSSSPGASEGGGTLASDEAGAALREMVSGGQS